MILDVAFATINVMEDKGKNSLLSPFATELSLQNLQFVRLSQKSIFIHVWYIPDTNMQNRFAPSNSQIIKIGSECKWQPKMAKVVFEN